MGYLVVLAVSFLMYKFAGLIGIFVVVWLLAGLASTFGVCMGYGNGSNPKWIDKIAKGNHVIENILQLVMIVGITALGLISLAYIMFEDFKPHTLMKKRSIYSPVAQR